MNSQVSPQISTLVAVESVKRQPKVQSPVVW